MTPAEKRARAKELRAEARRLVKEAEAEELAARMEAQRAVSRERTEEVAATMCPATWRSAPRGGPWVVKAVVDGRFVVGHPLHERDDRRHLVRGGHPDVWPPAVVYGQLDAPATLDAWRSWCAARRST